MSPTSSDCFVLAAHYKSLVSHLTPALALAVIISPTLARETECGVSSGLLCLFGPHFSDVFSLHKRYIKITPKSVLQSLHLPLILLQPPLDPNTIKMATIANLAD